MTKETFDINNIQPTSLLELYPMGVYFKDLDGVYQYCNKEFSNLVGYPKKEIIGKKLDEYLKGIDYKVHIENDKKLFKMGKSVSYVFQLLDFKQKDGLTFYKTTKSLIKDSEGKTVGVLGTLQDMTEEEINKERLELALSSTEEGIWDWHIPTNTVYYSPRWKAILGYKPNEIEDSFEQWRKLLHPEDLEYAEKYVGDFVAGKIKGNLDFNFRMQHKDGHYLTIRSVAMLVKSKDGKPERMIGTHKDVTEQEINKERLELALTGTAQGIWDWHIPTNTVYYSPRWKAILGYKPNEIEDSFEQWRKLLHPEDLEEAEKYVGDFVAGKIEGEFSFEFRMRHKKGHYVDILSKAMLVKSKDGKPSRMIGTHEDFSKYKKLNDRLERFKKAFEESSNSKVLVDYVDRKPKIVEVNESFSRIYGYKKEEVLGKEPKTLKSGKHDVQFYKKLWKDVLDPKIGSWMGEVVNKRKDGSFVDVILTINTFFNEKGKPTGFIAVHTDITKIKKAEKLLEEKVEELEEFNALVVDRELRMIELKETIQKLREKK